MRDPLILQQIDPWLGEMMDFFRGRVTEVTGETLGDKVHIDISVYGRDAVMGATEPVGAIGHEAGLLFTITAPTQEMANDVCRFVTHVASHWSIPEWDGFISGIAFPFSPPEIDRGMAYRFALHHVVTEVAPLELFRFEQVRV